MIFFDYIKLPIFIAEKVFNVFDKDKDNFLNQKEFIYGMNRLYNGNFDETLKLIFEILDFNHDEYIEKDDVKMILGLLPLKTDKTKDKIKYKYQMESLEEIQQIINLTFDNKKILNLEEFKDIVTKRKSDVFLQIICFLYQKKPFTDSNISVLSTSKKATDLENTPQINKKNKCDNVLMPSPLQSSTLSPFQQLQSGHIKSPFSLGSSLNVQEEFKPEISGFKGMIRYHNRNIPKAEDTKNGEMEENGSEKDVVKTILKNV
jgi:Ca2+-binding EF-hand superfamily protein